jgi:membrane-anchored protein YejM (alkaline phosphatase superfamily)
MKRSAFNRFISEIMPLIMSNTVVSLIISVTLFKYGVQGSGVKYLFFDMVTFVSHYFSINMLVGLVAFALTFFMPFKISLVIRGVLFLLLQAVLIADTTIFSIYRFHFNAVVWNVISTEGAGDSVILGKGTVTVFILLLLSVVAVQVFVFRFIYSKKKSDNSKRLDMLFRISKTVLIVCVAMIAIDKSVYAYADIVNNTKITKNVKLYPLYQPLTIKRFARKVLRIEINRENDFKVKSGLGNVVYPKEKLSFDLSSDNRPNIIIVVVEGLRFDMLDKEVMPNIVRFGRKNIVLKNHYSGGNGSRFGVFSLLYGIHGSYWHNFLSKRISPVLIDTLIDKEYDFKVLSSTRLTFPEFRKTAFIKIPDKIEDEFNERDMTRRDRIITDNFISYASTRDPQKPFFAFMFYNSSHQMYKYPAEFEKFRPVISKEDINYFLDTGSKKAHMIRNRYKNSVFYEDHLIGKIIDALQENGLIENTILVITGDHGEEFYENGYFGHTSSFNDYQTKTVFVMHYPGVEELAVERITSHMDLVPTIMKSIGCISETDLYSQGISIFADRSHKYVSATSWDKAAIIDNDHKIVFSTELYNLGSLEVRNAEDYALVDNYKDVIKQKKRLMLDVTVRMSEFYRN